MKNVKSTKKSDSPARKSIQQQQRPPSVEKVQFKEEGDVIHWPIYKADVKTSERFWEKKNNKLV